MATAEEGERERGLWRRNTALDPALLLIIWDAGTRAARLMGLVKVGEGRGVSPIGFLCIAARKAPHARRASRSVATRLTFALHVRPLFLERKALTVCPGYTTQLLVRV